jgi:2-polyprenyl-3-methyl-5-hydroxy-6-metoxy-1,4-benzoquinol methylase
MEDKQKTYYKHSRKEMLPFLPKSAKTILEIGCGQGNFSAQLVNKGMETWGIEPNEASSIEASKKLFKVLFGSLQNKLDEIPNDYFDVIILNDVLEHLLEPSDDLKLLKSKLSKDGVLISSIPNVRYSKNIFNLLFKKDWKYTESGILDSTHFRFFTKRSIQRMYVDCGYKIVKIKGVNMTKSFAFFPFAILFNILFLGTQSDMFFMQYASVAKRID